MDLSLLPFSKARGKIGKALSSKDPLARYWALIACSSFGKESSEFEEPAKAMARTDEDNLVRVRAAEFLALNGAADPQEIIYQVLKNAKTEVEANLILNIVTLLKDGELGYAFDIDPGWFDSEWMVEERFNVNRRLGYFETGR